MTGTTPRGTANEQAAAQWVREMFGRVAPRYDLLNHLLSFNLDKRWRARLAASVAPVLARPEARRGLEELLRVLKPGGMAAILEFSQPANRPFAALYGFFSKHVLPRVGGLISGSPEAYSYLPASIRKFPGAEELAVRLRGAGFARVEFERLTGGSVALHRAWK